MLWFTSDLHFSHKLPSLLEQRGFKTAAEMNEQIIANWNAEVDDDDDVYVLGDLMLTDAKSGMDALRCLHGNIHIIRGNHDTDNKLAEYQKLPNVVEIVETKILKYRGWRFYLSHYPTVTTAGHKPLKADIINLFGHTHQDTNFYVYPDTETENRRMYHVGLDSHHLAPVSFEQICTDLYQKGQQSGDILERMPRTEKTEAERKKAREGKRAQREDRLNTITAYISEEQVVATYEILVENGILPQNPERKDLHQIAMHLPKEVVKRYPAGTMGNDDYGEQRLAGKYAMHIIKQHFGL